MTTARTCPSCATPLPAEAVFCYMCGSATPQGIDRETGEFRTFNTGERVPSPDLERLKRALGASYELNKVIGRGGFAEVFLVKDLRLKRELALKALRPDLILSEALLTRFKREAETIAALRHPHIVPIYDIGEAEGIAYILMPLIKGESLKALLAREGPRPAREAMRILLECADALGAAHEAGVIHRDIKPENIMLEGKARRVQLMDFGIAKAIDTSSDPAGPTKGLTSTGMLVGTPHYMSPEQASGESNLDNRADQYSLAVVAYQMLTGSLPFDGESTRAILFQQMIAVPKSLRDLVPDVPAHLGYAVERALSKEPKDRYPSMEEFAEAITASDSLARPSAEHRVSSAIRDTQPMITAPVPLVPGPVPAPIIPARPRRKFSRWAGAVAVVGVVAVGAWFALPKSAPKSTSTPPAATATVTPSGPVTPIPAPPPPPPIVPPPPVAAALPPPAPPAEAQAKVAAPKGQTAVKKPSPPPPPNGIAAAAAAPVTETCATTAKKSDWAGALKLCTQEAQAGNIAAARLLAGMYERGQGVKQSDSAAVQLYQKAAQSGNSYAQYRLAMHLIKGSGVKQNEDSATKLLRAASDQGLSEAWPFLADRYAQGLGTKRNDQEAAFWYRKGADDGDLLSQVNMGQIYAQGRGVDKSEAEAARWFEKAASRDSPVAQYQLGMMYVRGKGVPKSEEEGLKWLDKAAQQGHQEAQKEVAKRRRT
ncbi:MAG: protein kinase [Gemmatimonadota bacterium]